MNAKERDKILEELNEGSLTCEYSGNVEFWQKIFDVAYKLGADHKTKELQEKVERLKEDYDSLLFAKKKTDRHLQERFDQLQQLKQDNKELVEENIKVKELYFDLLDKSKKDD